MHNTECRFVTTPSNAIFAGVYTCTFQPGHIYRLGTVKGLTQQ